jgi:outer membrane biosynthesis protein TonB
MAIGPGEVFVELSVSATGRVEKVTPIRITPPFTQMVIDTVSDWTFTPAVDDPIGPTGRPLGPRAVPSKVLVAAMYRAPTLLTPTQGQEPAVVAAASREVAYPSMTMLPVYPVQAQFGGVVLIEMRIPSIGAAIPKVISSSGPFDSAALEAAQQWRFYPARVRGDVDTYAYLIFGFHQPITGRGPGY